MPDPNDLILMDANAIIESYRVGCFGVLSQRFQLESVEKCIEETQTGNQKRRTEERIDEASLRDAFSQIHHVTELEIAKLELMNGPILDDGEKALWAHALGREDVWFLCGPDTASMKFGYSCDCKDRLVSLGGLLGQVGYTPKIELKPHYQKDWLDGLIHKWTMGLL
jgi:hypothetical protein